MRHDSSSEQGEKDWAHFFPSIVCPKSQEIPHKGRFLKELKHSPCTEIINCRVVFYFCRSQFLSLLDFYFSAFKTPKSMSRLVLAQLYTRMSHPKRGTSVGKRVQPQLSLFRSVL